MATERDVFDSVSPIDYRYWNEKAARYLSEGAFTIYKCRVEVALVTVLAKRGICSPAVVQEVTDACTQVRTDEVYVEEKRVGHDIRALVNCIQKRVGDESKRFVHMTATSFDISDTANAMRYKQFVQLELLPAVHRLKEVLSDIARSEANTLQIGRTHGQHAVPITFGFAMAGFVSRLGQAAANIGRAADRLGGQVFWCCGCLQRF